MSVVCVCVGGRGWGLGVIHLCAEFAIITGYVHVFTFIIFPWVNLIFLF